MTFDKVKRFFLKLEDMSAGLAILILTVLPIAEAILRKFSLALPSVQEYSLHLVLLITFIGAMITSREDGHLGLAAMRDFFKGRTREIINALCAFLSVMVSAFLAFSSLPWIVRAFSLGQVVGIIPKGVLLLVIPLSFLVMAIRFVLHASDKISYRLLALAGFVPALVLSFPTLYDGLILDYVFNTPDWMYYFVDFVKQWNAALSILFIIIMIVGAVFGVPIFITLAGISLFLFSRIVPEAGISLEVISYKAYTTLIDQTIPAIPLFTFAGFLLSESKAGERLVTFFRAFFGWMPGGMAIAAVLVSAFFTTFTGASGVTILALGGLLLFALAEKGSYSRNMASGLLTSSGSIGLLFPPAIPLIMYSIISHVDIKDIFLAGLIPGFLMVLGMSLWGVIYAYKAKVPREKFEVKKALAALKEAVWEIFLPIIILVGYLTGQFTLVETGGVAVAYSILVVFVIHKDLKLKDWLLPLKKALPILGGVLIILAAAASLSYFFTDARVPNMFASWLSEYVQSKYVFLILLNIALLITGCFMDIFSAIMVVVPLLVPMAAVYQIDPAHLGIIFLANMGLGYLTPPVGLNLFLAAYRFDEPLNKMYKNILPGFLVLLAVVLIITYVPFLSTWLPGLVK